jgi:hypothetical protein
MEITTGEHHAPPLSPTIFHFFPHGAKIRPLLGKCQEKKNKKKEKNPLMENLLWVAGCLEGAGRRVVDPHSGIWGRPQVCRHGWSFAAGVYLYFVYFK